MNRLRVNWPNLNWVLKSVYRLLVLAAMRNSWFGSFMLVFSAP